jgi:hypothetical protein
MTNQLELELGVLTDVQQERVNSFVKSQKSEVEKLISLQTKIEGLLISGGFKAGIDYINDLEYSMVNEYRNFGYREDAFTSNVTYMKSSGGCKIIFKRYNKSSNKIEVNKSMVYNEHNKLECSAITPQYRAYLPSSLFDKLLENNNKAQLDYNSANREKTVINYTIDKYKILFPNATVNVSNDYSKNYKGNYTEFPIITVTFENGSYVSFRLGYENDKEFVHKKFDAIASKLTAIELLNVFNDQNIK